MSIEALMEVVPPPATPSETFDGPWEPLEAELGRALPRDYKDFVRLYGLGAFVDFILIYVPRCSYQYARFEAEVRAVHEVFGDDEDFRKSLWPARGGLLVFGRTDFGDYLFWLTRGPPDEWPVVVWGRGHWKLEEFECSFTDFLTGIAKNEIEPQDFPEGPYEATFETSVGLAERNPL